MRIIIILLLFIHLGTSCQEWWDCEKCIKQNCHYYVTADAQGNCDKKFQRVKLLRYKAISINNCLLARKLENGFNNVAHNKGPTAAATVMVSLNETQPPSKSYQAVNEAEARYNRTRAPLLRVNNSKDNVSDKESPEIINPLKAPNRSTSTSLLHDIAQVRVESSTPGSSGRDPFKTLRSIKSTAPPQTKASDHVTTVGMPDVMPVSNKPEALPHLPPTEPSSKLHRKINVHVRDVTQNINETIYEQNASLATLETRKEGDVKEHLQSTMMPFHTYAPTNTSTTSTVTDHPPSVSTGTAHVTQLSHMDADVIHLTTGGTYENDTTPFSLEENGSLNELTAINENITAEELEFVSGESLNTPLPDKDKNETVLLNYQHMLQENYSFNCQNHRDVLLKVERGLCRVARHAGKLNDLHTDIQAWLDKNPATIRKEICSVILAEYKYCKTASGKLELKDEPADNSFIQSPVFYVTLGFCYLLLFLLYIKVMKPTRQS